jgi:hypothetical protein
MKNRRIQPGTRRAVAARRCPDTVPPGRSSRASAAAAQTPRAAVRSAGDWQVPSECDDDGLFTDPDLDRPGFRPSQR